MSDNSTPGTRHGAGTYEMLWDCKFCGTKKLLGLTHRHCPNCGAAQDPAWRYMPAEEDMVAVENHQYVGADKICPACQQPNSAANTYCVACGADLATGQIAQTQPDRVIGTGRAETDTRHDVVKDAFDADMSRIAAEESRRKRYLGLPKRRWTIIGVVALAVVVIAAVVYAITYRKDVTGTVEALTWQRTITIQDYQPRPGAAWRNQVPFGAYGQSCVQREHGSRQVADGSHQECKDVDQGDGTMKRECRTVTDYKSEPIYDDWCTYTIDAWDNARQVKANGSGKVPAPDWPAYMLATASGRYGAERVGAKSETYTVSFRDSDNKQRACDFETQATWDQYDVGMAVTVRLYLTGKPDCDTLKAGP